MAEGLDGAADAFRQEIAPGSDRSRDESGRFSSVSQRPEPLFEPRPLEGDEKTGDTRDAGEDPRLKAIERRVADGRAEEGDADELDRVSDDAARSRDADGERQGDGSPKPDDKKPDGEGEADEDGAEDADAARWALTHDGKPVEKIEIDIGGETKQVSLQEVVKGYAEQEAINQRARQVEEYARTFEHQSAQVAQEIGQARQTYQQRLEYIGRVMADLYPKELNWEAGYYVDPPRRAPTRRSRSSSTSAAAWNDRRRNAARTGPGPGAIPGPDPGRSPAGSGLRRMGQTGVQAKNRDHRHRNAEQ